MASARIFSQCAKNRSQNFAIPPLAERVPFKASSTYSQRRITFIHADVIKTRPIFHLVANQGVCTKDDVSEGFSEIMALPAEVRFVLAKKSMER